MTREWKGLADIRREYGDASLTEDTARDCPIAQFEQWLAEVLQTETHDPTAMVLSTSDERGCPDSRVVLLKAIEHGGFVFFTNYQSAKAMQLAKNPYAALNFYWPHTVRQVRVRGRVKQISSADSDAYFSTRPALSQLSAIVSHQSQEISERTALEQRLNELIEHHQMQPIVRPDYWGGYVVLPEEIEFWQGRDNRLHDRIHYYRQAGQWLHRRLAP